MSSRAAEPSPAAEDVRAATDEMKRAFIIRNIMSVSEFLNLMEGAVYDPPEDRGVRDFRPLRPSFSV